VKEMEKGKEKKEVEPLKAVAHGTEVHVRELVKAERKNGKKFTGER
jgi:hypothetical protein